MADDRSDWFAPKRFGYGAGRPIAWQGWALLAAYLGLVAGALMLLANVPLAQASIIIPATAGLIILAARRTRGGWRWRWGERD